jgi:hypothetical protein
MRLPIATSMMRLVLYLFLPIYCWSAMIDKSSWLLCLGCESISTVEQAYFKLGHRDSSRKEDENNHQDIKVRKFDDMGLI